MATLVRSAALTKYSGVAQALGLDPERMVSHVGADRACLYMPDLRVPEPWIADVFEASAKSANCPAIGLLVAEVWRLSDFGPISLLLQHQPTLRHALAEMERYRHLLSDSVAMPVEEAGGVAIVRILLVTGRPDPGRQAIELSVGVALSLMRALLGSAWMPRGVHFSHAAPTSYAIHSRVFGPKIEFGGEFDGIVLEQRDLDRPNPLADATLARYAKELLALQPRAGQESIAADTRRAIHVLMPQGHNTIELVAPKLGLSSRTLQRRLEQEGEDFSSLVNEVRMELAARYLADPRYPVSQVAMLLGFSQISSFSRWFSTQFGLAPTRWRHDAPGRAIG
nr:AraC family transcriptional regulator [uncultured Ralstonia sp.]